MSGGGAGGSTKINMRSKVVFIDLDSDVSDFSSDYSSEPKNLNNLQKIIQKYTMSKIDDSKLFTKRMKKDLYRIYKGIKSDPQDHDLVNIVFDQENKELKNLYQNVPKAKRLSECMNYKIEKIKKMSFTDQRITNVINSLTSKYVKDNYKILLKNDIYVFENGVYTDGQIIYPSNIILFGHILKKHWPQSGHRRSINKLYSKYLKLF